MTIPALLEEAIGPPLAPPPPVDWPLVRGRLGTDLPSDYQELANRYPLLFFDEWLPMLHPATPEPPRNPYNLESLLFSAITQSRFIPDFEPTHLYTYTPGDAGGTEEVTPIDGIPFPIFPEPGGLMIWGVPENGSYCCWLTEGHPDDWTIVVVSEPEVWHYRGSITEFLVDILIRRVHCRAFPADFPVGDNWQVKQVFD